MAPTNTKVKISHIHPHTLGVGKSAAWGPVLGVRLSSDHSILQIPACNYTGRFDSALCLLSTNWKDGADHPHILLGSYTLTTHHGEPPASEGKTEAPLFTACSKPKHLEPKIFSAVGSLGLC